MTRRVCLETIREAATAIHDAAIRAPLIRSDLTDHPESLSDLYLQMETRQPIGSFAALTGGLLTRDPFPEAHRGRS